MIRRAALFLALTLLMTGCWSRTEINELVFPLAIGIDRTENGYRMTIQVASPPKGEQGGAGGFWLQQTERPTVDEAAHILQLQSGSRPHWSHLALVVFGRSLAEEGVAPVLDYLVRVLELRETAMIAVAHGNASDVLAGRLAGQSIPGVGFQALLKSAFQAAMQPAISIAKFAGMLMQPGRDPYAAMVRVKEDGTIFFTGMAVFQHDRLVRVLDDKETRGFLRAVPGQQHAMVSLSCPDGRPAFLREDGLTTRLIPIMKGQTVQRFSVEIRMTGYLSEGMCRGALVDTQLLRDLERQAERAVKEEAIMALTAAREAQADIFAFGMRAYRKGGRIPGGNAEWTALPVDFDVSITLDREGITVNENGIKKRRP